MTACCSRLRTTCSCQAPARPPCCSPISNHPSFSNSQRTWCVFCEACLHETKRTICSSIISCRQSVELAHAHKHAGCAFVRLWFPRRKTLLFALAHKSKGVERHPGSQLSYRMQWFSHLNSFVKDELHAISLQGYLPAALCFAGASWSFSCTAVCLVTSLSDEQECYAVNARASLEAHLSRVLLVIKVVILMTSAFRRGKD